MDLDLNAILISLISKFPAIGYLLMALGTLVVLGQAYVAITPTETDDAWFAKLEKIPVLGHLISVIKSFAPLQRKIK